MKLHCRKSVLNGTVEIPGSKSHTIRAVAIASMASGDSVIRAALASDDTAAAIRSYSALGATFRWDEETLHVQGTGGDFHAPSETIDVGNSGTTLRIAMGSCALLAQGDAVLTGDEQIRRRPAGPLAASLTDLGARVSSQGDNGCAPFKVEGRLRGGETSIEAVTSQYLSSLLMCTPLAENDTRIRVPLLNEAPYVGITLNWLDRQGIRIEFDDYSEFHVPGGQQYRPVDVRIPGDFSSATFFLAAGALGENDVVCRGLDMNDTQGDRDVVDYLSQMGAYVTIEDGEIRVRANELAGCELDLNATPDALPMMAVVGCFARGQTRLVNVPQARLKETDRIAVMCQELTRMGARITELRDGLVIEESRLRGAALDGHGDHRVVMALAVAGTMAEGDTTIDGSEAASVTYPGFVDALESLRGKVAVCTE